MNKTFFKISLFVAIAGLAIIGILAWQKWQPGGPIISGTGTIKFINLEGGFYGIDSDDGQKYDAINLNADNPQFREFLKDGLRVKFTVREKPDYANIHMWGKTVLINEIEKLPAETAG